MDNRCGVVRPHGITRLRVALLLSVGAVGGAFLVETLWELPAVQLLCLMPNRPRPASGSGLWLNAVHLPFPDQAIPAAMLPFDLTRFHELLDRAEQDLLPVRQADDTMAVVPIMDGATLPVAATELAAPSHAQLFATLAREAIFRSLRASADRTGVHRLISRRPPEVESAKDSKIVPPGAGLPPWLTKRVVVTFETRVVRLPKLGTAVVLSCSERLRTIIGSDCGELIRCGVKLAGRYVSQLATAKDPMLDGSLKLSGRVIGLDGADLLLDDNGDGPARLPTSEAFLEPTRANFEAVVEALTQGSAARLLGAIEVAEGQWRAGDLVRARVEAAFDYLRRAGLFVARGMPLVLGDVLGGASLPPAQVFQKPLLSFDPNGSQSDSWAQRMLDRIGPYDRQSFETKRPRIAVVCEAGQRGRMAEAVADLLNGVPDAVSRTGLVPHETGLVGRFRLQKACVEFFEAQAATGDAYAAASRRALEAAGAADRPWDLALVQVRREWKERLESDSPYWATKATFLKRDVPVQALATDTMEMGRFEYACALANASLASYAKLGGKPWLLRARPSTDHELVFGLGSHTRRVGRRGGGDRVVGITTVFSSQGDYLLDARTAAVPFEQYPEKLMEVLTDAVGRVRREEAWRAGDTVRLIFHAFTQVRRETADAVVAAVTRMDLDKVAFAFLHVAEEHPFTVLDTGQQSGKGAFAPERGQALEISEREWLVSLAGRKEVKVLGQGVPAPVLLRLHPDSTFKDMMYLSRQVADFACHSWRTFGPTSAPISLLYADEIAKQLAGLERTPGWDPDASTGRVMRRPWFL